MYSYLQLLCCIIGIGYQTSYYDLLEIPPTSSQADIRKAYFRQAKRMHPDKNKAADAHLAFQNLGRAYETLKQPESRDAYDRTLQSECPTIICRLQCDNVP